MESLSYNPLDIPSRAIRLLILQPGTMEDDIECQLTQASLDDKPIYEAISYVWGDPNITVPITVNGSRFQVTVNLERALRRLRQPHTSRVLWADAICINQKDLVERSHQVSVMGAVYSQCRECQIWLGEEDDVPFEPSCLHLSQGFNSNVDNHGESHEIGNIRPPEPRVPVPRDETRLDVPAALELLKLLGTDKHLYDLPFHKPKSFPNLALCETWSHAFSSLLNIWTRPWWSRMWTAQECILPPTAMVHIGPYSVDLQLFISANDCFMYHYGEGCCSWFESDSWAPAGGHTKYLYGVVSVMNSLSNMWRLFRDNREYEQSPMEYAYLISRERYCSDPRDNVYGLLGVVPVLLQDNALPEYDSEVATAYSRATLRLFEYMGGLFHLQNANMISSNPYKLPSWSLDWSRKELMFLLFDYNACGAFEKFELIEGACDKNLVVEGVFLGTIEEVSDELEAERYEHRNLPELATRLQKIRDLACTKSGIDDKAFLSVLFVGRSISSMGPQRRSVLSDQDLVMITDWWEWLMNCSAEGSDILNDCHSVFISRHELRSSRFFTLNTGSFGLSQSNIRKDDKIFVLKGSSVPFILRPCVSPSADSSRIEVEGAHYNVVSPCYVHGIMDGEAMEGDPKWEKLVLC